MTEVSREEARFRTFPCALSICVMAAVWLASAPASAGEKCINMTTQCPGKGWVTTACDDPDPCGLNRGGYVPPARDYEAERRQQEGAAAETAAAAERERQAEEQRRKEAAEKQAAFVEGRDRAASSLKGSSDASLSPRNSGLKGLNDDGLKGAASSNGLKGSTTSSPVESKQDLAWKQLHCAASIASYALSALQTQDHAEFTALSVEALNALDGKRVNVECGKAPPFPTGRGKAVDMDRGIAKERQVLAQASAIADRMKSRGDQKTAPAATAPAGPETADEKARRVQKEVNAVNDVKVTGKTQQEIDQQEKDRKALAKLILVNNGLEKGVFAAIDEVPRAPRAQRTPVPVPAPQP